MADRDDQILRCRGINHHRIRQTNAERLFEAEQQLHSLEAADAHITIEGVVECRPARGRSAQFLDHPGDDIENLIVDGGVGGRIRSGHGAVHRLSDARIARPSRKDEMR